MGCGANSGSVTDQASPLSIRGLTEYHRHVVGEKAVLLPRTPVTGKGKGP